MSAPESIPPSVFPGNPAPAGPLSAGRYHLRGEIGAAAWAWCWRRTTRRWAATWR
jgi:hypothetical protein